MLRPGGAYLYVVPAARHLWQLKEVLYDRPYPNEERETPYEGFAYQEILPVSFTVHLPAQADIRALFQMTPYYWKTPGRAPPGWRPWRRWRARWPFTSTCSAGRPPPENVYFLHYAEKQCRQIAQSSGGFRSFLLVL